MSGSSTGGGISAMAWGGSDSGKGSTSGTSGSGVVGAIASGGGCATAGVAAASAPFALSLTGVDAAFFESKSAGMLGRGIETLMPASSTYTDMRRMKSRLTTLSLKRILSTAPGGRSLEECSSTRLISLSFALIHRLFAVTPPIRMMRTRPLGPGSASALLASRSLKRSR